MQLPALLNRKDLTIVGMVAIVWLVAVIDWLWVSLLPVALQSVVFDVVATAAAGWLWWSWHVHGQRSVWFWLALTITFPVFWQLCLFSADAFGLELLRVYIFRAGLVVLFFTGLAWLTWRLESITQEFESARRETAGFDLQAVLGREKQETEVRTSNPLDPAAWYYGRQSPRLSQSVSSFVSYSFVFLLVCMILSRLQGCTKYYDLPAGGGEQQTVAQVVKIQKIIRKKFVVNPYSAILFDVPEIDEIKLELNEVTAHQYKIGYGEGEGAGFAGGTSKGVVGFYRLEYSGGDWNLNFGIGGDLNMLIKYTELTSQKIDKRTKALTPAQLATFDGVRCPPLIYINGQKSISLSNKEVKILQEYLLDKHGMLFGDNGGSPHFHRQFIGMMQNVLPDVRPVRIPADDKIHRIPFAIPEKLYVSPHGGEYALGWFKDGRWMCYYHPGDIGDAWADGHAGVSAEIWNMCYRLGVNVINYAHAEHAKWRLAQQKKDDKG